MTTSDKNIFSKAVRKSLVDAEMTIKDLSVQIGRPRETVSKTIHGSKRFPAVRLEIATRLNLKRFLPS